MMAEVAGVYARIILQFLGELYIFYALIMFRLERADRFILKLLCGLAAVAAAAFGAAVFYYYFGQNVYGRIATYFFLFGISTIHARICFNESYPTIFFCCCLAYAAQNMVYKIYLIIWCVVELARATDGWGGAAELYYRLIYLSIFAVFAAAEYFVLIRPQMKRLTDSSINVRMLLIAALVLGITIILCSFEDVYFNAFSYQKENRYDDFNIYVLRQTGNVFSALCCGAVLLLTSQTLVDRDLKREVGYLQYTIRQGEKQYDMTKSTMDMINVKYHDIKYKVNALLAEGSGGAQAAGELLKDISVYDANVATGNKILDVLLTEKSLYCEQNGISFTCMADGGCLDFMEDGDLYCLFGNIVDNALEAVKKLTDPEKRTISLSVRRQGGLVTIEEENYFSGSLTFEDGLPKTTKDDKAYHGFGTRSIKMIATKYGGAMTASADGDVYSLCVILSAQVKNNGPQNR